VLTVMQLLEFQAVHLDEIPTRFGEQ